MHTISATGSTQHRQGSYLARAARTMIKTKALCTLEGVFNSLGQL